MKILYLFSGLVLCMVISGCGQSKLETENSDLKNQISKSATENTQLKIEVALLKQETNELGAKITEQANQRQQQDIQQKQQEQEDKSKIINEDLENIVAHLDRLNKEPKLFGKSASEDRDAEEDRLKKLASSEEATIQEIINKLESEGFTKKEDLQNLIEDFDGHFKSSVYWERAWHDIGYGISFDDPKVKEDTTKSQQEFFDSLKDIYSIKHFEQ